jgi:rod shape-determining protein MreD
MKHFKRVGIFGGGLFAQWFFSRYASFHGLIPQILLILTINAAAYWGTSEAMVFGFGWGLCWDFFSLRLFGARALVLTLIGYASGMLKRQIDIMSPGSQALVVIFSTLFYRLCLGLISLVFIGKFLWLGWIFFLLEPLYNGLASLVLYLFRSREKIR